MPHSPRPTAPVPRSPAATGIYMPSAVGLVRPNLQLGSASSAAGGGPGVSLCSPVQPLPVGSFRCRQEGTSRGAESCPGGIEHTALGRRGRGLGSEDRMVAAVPTQGRRLGRSFRAFPSLPAGLTGRPQPSQQQPPSQVGGREADSVEPRPPVTPQSTCNLLWTFLAGPLHPFPCMHP